jgi:hypothetical protein
MRASVSSVTQNPRVFTKINADVSFLGLNKLVQRSCTIRDQISIKTDTISCLRLLSSCSYLLHFEHSLPRRLTRLDKPMRTVLCIALLSTLSVGISPQANAVPCQGAVLAARMLELPLIPLEKSLIPRRSTVESTHSSAALAKDNHTLANAIVRGLLVANRTGEINYTAPLSYRVQDVVRSLRRGDALGKAQRYGGVSFRVVHRLLKLGTRSLDIN